MIKDALIILGGLSLVVAGLTTDPRLPFYLTIVFLAVAATVAQRRDY